MAFCCLSSLTQTGYGLKVYYNYLQDPYINDSLSWVRTLISPYALRYRG